MKKRLCHIVLLLFIAVYLAGCGMESFDFPSQVEIQQGGYREESEDAVSKEKLEAAAPKKGGQITIPIPYPDTMNPLLTQSKDMVSFFGIIFESLFELDENLEPRPVLVDKWEFSEDRKVIFFHLKKGVKWHNGTELTGVDVLFTFQALRSGKLDSIYNRGISDNLFIEEMGVQADDPYTVYIQLRQPICNILEIMTFPILPRDVYQSVEYMVQNKGNLNLYPVGTGPYKIANSWSENYQEIILARNEEWWGEEPYLDSIKVKVFRDNRQARSAFQSGQVDLIDTPVIYANAFTESGNVNLYRYLTHNYEFLGFNNDHPILKDVQIRKAIAFAIDRKGIISEVYLNNAEAVDVPIPTNSWLYDAKQRVYDYDPERAKQILKESGWNDTDGNGILDKIINGQKVELYFRIITNQDNDMRKDALDLVVKQLEEVGIKAEAVFLDWNEMVEQVLPEGQFDAILGGYYLDAFPDLRFAFHSREMGNGLNNFIRYQNADFDRLLDEIDMISSKALLKEHFQSIQKHLVEQLPIISLYFRTASLIVNENIKGIRHPMEMNIYRDIEKWYIG